MMSLNISGKLLNWTKNFLSNRTYQVKVGDALSFEYSNLNGTPQGSSYSPLLFLIMVNYFPKMSLYTSNGFFADDCTIWRSGTNIESVLHHLQQDLNKISEWCNKWGFIINTNKTTGIVFTNKKINILNIKLKINGELIKFENTCRLLGVIMDSHLTWTPHRNYIVEKSNKGLNLMRCLSGTGWGSSKRVLLTLHKSLILSNLDYCSFVYINASASTLKKIDTIQYKSLLIVVGGMKGTALNALLGECGEVPMDLRRKKILIKYLLKLHSNPNNSAHGILTDRNFYHLQLKNKSVYLPILHSYLQDNNIVLKSEIILYSDYPWPSLDDNVDLSALKDLTYATTGQVILDSNKLTTVIVQLKTLYQNVIYVDGSVREEGKVGVAILCPEIDLKRSFKLPDGLSIYFAEAFAILNGIKAALDKSCDKFVIISDNFRVLEDILSSNYSLSPNPFIIYQIRQELLKHAPKPYLLKWLPGDKSQTNLK